LVSGLINEDQLNDAYQKNGFYSLQLEVGDKCYQGCIYCYMNALPKEKNSLRDEQINNILEDAFDLGINAIEWLGGEPLLRDSIFHHLSTAKMLGFRNNMWTGGLPLFDENVANSCVESCRLGLISIHLSTIDPEMYKRLHPNYPKDDLNKILKGLENVLDAGYPSQQMLNSVTFTGLQPAEDMIKTMDYFEEKFGIKTSLNIYHSYLRPGSDPRDLKRFIPEKKEVAKVYRRYKRQYGNKPLPLNCVNKQYCATTVAVLSDGSVTPCATIRPENASNIHLDGSFKEIVERQRNYLILSKLKNTANLPISCQKCFMNDECWGCRSRAYAAGLGIYGPDPLCFRSKTPLTE